MYRLLRLFPVCSTRLASLTKKQHSFPHAQQLSNPVWFGSRTPAGEFICPWRDLGLSVADAITWQSVFSKSGQVVCLTVAAVVTPADPREMLSPILLGKGKYFPTPSGLWQQCSLLLRAGLWNDHNGCRILAGDIYTGSYCSFTPKKERGLCTGYSGLQFQ